MPPYSFYGLSDPVSSLSHFLGAIICLISSVPLWRSVKGNFGHRLAVGVFSFSCVFLLVMSGVYHLLPYDSTGRLVLMRLDHAAIFVLIAGTFTPMHAILFRGVWRWAPLATIWGIATAGIVLKSVYFSQISSGLGISIYLTMGWLGAISAGLVWSQWGFALVKPLLGGSFVYSFGTLFEFFRGPILIPGVIGSHELFHFAVLAGIACHWQFVRKVALTSSAPLPIVV